MNEIILTTEERLTEIVNCAIMNALNAQCSRVETTKTEGHIKGISGLSKFLGVSHSRAQALKNSGIFPHFQTGRLIIFDPSKVREAMEAHGKRERRAK